MADIQESFPNKTYKINDVNLLNDAMVCILYLSIWMGCVGRNYGVTEHLILIPWLMGFGYLYNRHYKVQYVVHNFTDRVYKWYSNFNIHEAIERGL
jgi:hypothetical protein